MYCSVHLSIKGMISDDYFIVLVYDWYLNVNNNHEMFEKYQMTLCVKDDKFKDQKLIYTYDKFNTVVINIIAHTPTSFAGFPLHVAEKF